MYHAADRRPARDAARSAISIVRPRGRLIFLTSWNDGYRNSHAVASRRYIMRSPTHKAEANPAHDGGGYNVRDRKPKRSIRPLALNYASRTTPVIAYKA